VRCQRRGGIRRGRNDQVRTLGGDPREQRLGRGGDVIGGFGTAEVTPRFLDRLGA
jgi:hypothetical protein